MVDLLQSSTRNSLQMALWTVKLGFLSIGIVSTVLLLKLTVPYSVNAVLSAIPRLWISFRIWLAPPYLYIIVNFIIIIIAASSRFQQKHCGKKGEEVVIEAENENLSEKHWEKKNSEEAVIEAENENHSQKQERSDLASGFLETSTEIWPDMEEIPQEYVENSLVCVEKSPETRSDISFLTDSDEKTESDLSVSSSFACRKSSGTSRRIEKSAVPPQKTAKSVGVAKPEKQNDTLDSTWKMITEGRGKPLMRHLKKSDTWDVPPRVNDPDSDLNSSSAVTDRRELRKLETFNDASSSASLRGGGRMIREISLSQDELNHRVEAFIKKFNDDIRLQRQESENRYMEMVNRGIYT